MAHDQTIPEAGFLRLRQILGDKRAHPPLPAIIPISKASWYAGVQSGKYPSPVKSARTALYKIEDIKALLKAINSGELA